MLVKFALVGDYIPSSKPSSPATSSSVTSIRDSTAIVAGIGSSSEKITVYFIFKFCLHRVDITENASTQFPT